MLNGSRRELTLVALLASLALAGCGSTAGKISLESAGMTPPPVEATETIAAADAGPASTPVADDEPSLEPAAAPAPPRDGLGARNDDLATEILEDYDPWERFNQKMFAFNHGLDRHVVKPAAKAYDVVMPEPWQEMIGRAFDNLRWPVRFVNNLLQRKWEGAGRELARFLINSVAGVGGVFDPAKDYWGIQPSAADFGQTLGKWGAGAGPYLVLPFLAPMTIRDGIGMGVDSATNPLGYFVTPFIWDGLGLKVGDTVNDRAQNIELYQGLEETVVDLYSAVRNAYLRRREQRVRD